jgi:hypothetical protein
MGGLPHHPVELSLLARVVIAGPTALQAAAAVLSPHASIAPIQITPRDTVGRRKPRKWAANQPGEYIRTALVQRLRTDGFDLATALEGQSRDVA